MLPWTRERPSPRRVPRYDRLLRDRHGQGAPAKEPKASPTTDADLGEPWAATEGAATWRDGLLKATANAPDCQCLLDTLYAEEFFGADARVTASTGLDDTWNDAQLHHQVVADRPADVDKTLTSLKSLPKVCGECTAVATTSSLGNRGQNQLAPSVTLGQANQWLPDVTGGPVSLPSRRFHGPARGAGSYTCPRSA
ncbi:hypothetical protein [Streptomyces viridochromogenes]|uniref:hypothetical protein n=1 Tax=Streptomyces viridochromogenes TaxID=1938 RepID=UPI000B269214|nr:hypothetical protein [Streptomyces viridochromogenes]